jgi:hypothetical protein
MFQFFFITASFEAATAILLYLEAPTSYDDLPRIGLGQRHATRLCLVQQDANA